MTISPTMSDDFALLEKWQRGEAAAGNELFSRHFDSIYRFFLYKAHGEVEDMVQRTFLSCVEARDRFAHKSSFRTFLFGIARNELRHFFRRRKKDDVLDFAVSSIAELNPSPSTMARHRGRTQQLMAALESLPVDLQLALELHYLEGLSGPALAEVLEVPEGTVRSRLHRAREQVAEKLAALGGGNLHTEGEDFARWASALRACFGAGPSDHPTA
jgi:RNA polymerase sigma-70 factor (ECF subfamily)